MSLIRNICFLFMMLSAGCTSIRSASYPFKQPNHKFKMVQWLGHPCYHIKTSFEDTVMANPNVKIGLCEDGTVVWEYKE